MLAAGLEPLAPYPGRNSLPWPARCRRCGEQASPCYSTVQQTGRGCRTCGHAATGRAKRVSEERAFGLMRAAGAEPLEPYPGNKDRAWRCLCTTCGNVVAPTYGNVRRGQGPCAFCAGNLPLSADAAASIVMTGGFEPVEPYPGSASHPWRCRCRACGRLSSPSTSTVKSGTRCRYCAGNTVDPLDAARFMRERGVQSLEPYPGSAIPWRCRCLECGSEITPTFANVRKGQGACTPCSYRRARVHETIAEAVMRGGGVEPLEPYPGGAIKWRCRCLTCGRIVRPRYNNVRAGQGGCWYCRAPGIGPGDPAIVYFLVHPAYRAVKIGIAAAHRQRIARHERHGWRVLNEWHRVDGATAAAAETAVLRAWRKVGVPDAVPASDMPQGGHTETAPLDLVDIAQVRLLVEQEIALAAACEVGQAEPTSEHFVKEHP